MKTVDVRINELRDDPSNIKLLYDVMALICANIETLKDDGIKDHDVVNYVLASALKADQIEAKNLGLVMNYLNDVNAPSIYYQYAILRVHQNLHKVKLIDITLTLQEMFHLVDQDKMIKLMKRIENHFEVTNESLLLDNKGGNLKALTGLYVNFAHNKYGQPPFWKKLERLLAQELEKKKYVINL